MSPICTDPPASGPADTEPSAIRYSAEVPPDLTKEPAVTAFWKLAVSSPFSVPRMVTVSPKVATPVHVLWPATDWSPVSFTASAPV